jgi:hypothetical protein
MACRVLLTTIPKCGKNVLISFLAGLGLERRPGDTDVFEAATHMQARWSLRRRPGAPAQDELKDFLDPTAPAFERLLDGLAAMPDNSYLHGHFVFDPELHRRARDAGISIVFLYRDPRACLASLAHFLLDRHEPASLARRLPGRDLSTVLRFLVEGDAEAPPFEDFYTPYDGWREAEGVTTLRFEDVIGPRGGGSDEAQHAVLTSLAERIGWHGEPARLATAIGRTFNPSAGTFRRGTIDGWQDDLRPLRRTIYWERVHKLARGWGYVDDLGPSPMVARCRPGRPKEESQVQRWEYRLLLVYANMADLGAVQQVDGMNLPANACPSTLDALNEAGEEGWELVGVRVVGTWTTLYLKRPKLEA